MPSLDDLIRERRPQANTATSVDALSLPEDTSKETVEQRSNRLVRTADQLMISMPEMQEFENSRQSINNLYKRQKEDSGEKPSDTPAVERAGKSLMRGLKGGDILANSYAEQSMGGVFRQLAESGVPEYLPGWPSSDFLLQWGKDARLDAIRQVKENPETQYAIDPNATFGRQLYQMVSSPENLIRGTVANMPLMLIGGLGQIFGGKGGNILTMASYMQPVIYADAREEGTPPLAALLRSWGSASVESAIESWTFGAKLKLLTMPQQGVSGFIWNMLKAFGRGTAEETLQGIQDNIWRWLFTDRDQKWLEGLSLAAAMGGPLEAIMSLGFMGVGAPVNMCSRQESLNRVKNLESIVSSSPLSDDAKQELSTEFNIVKNDISQGLYDIDTQRMLLSVTPQQQRTIIDGFHQGIQGKNVVSDSSGKRTLEILSDYGKWHDALEGANRIAVDVFASTGKFEDVKKVWLEQMGKAYEIQASAWPEKTDQIITNLIAKAESFPEFPSLYKQGYAEQQTLDKIKTAEQEIVPEEAQPKVIETKEVRPETPAEPTITAPKWLQDALADKKLGQQWNEIVVTEGSKANLNKLLFQGYAREGQLKDGSGAAIILTEKGINTLPKDSAFRQPAPPTAEAPKTGAKEAGFALNPLEILRERLAERKKEAPWQAEILARIQKTFEDYYAADEAKHSSAVWADIAEKVVPSSEITTEEAITFLPPAKQVVARKLEDGKYGLFHTMTDKRLPADQSFDTRRQAKKYYAEQEIIETVAFASDIPPALQPVIKDILTWVQTAKKLRETEVVAAIHELRAKQMTAGTARLGKGLKGGEASWTALEKSIGAYKIDAGVPTITPLDLTDEQWNILAQRIIDRYPADNVEEQFKRTDTQKALWQLRNGKVPTPRDFDLLEKILGRRPTRNIFSYLSKFRPQNLFWESLRTTIAVYKSPQSLDVQSVRQAASIAMIYPVEYTKMTGVASRAYISERYAEEKEMSLFANPNHEDASKYLHFISTSPYSVERAEWFQFGLGEKLQKLPKWSGIHYYGEWLLASERSFATGIDEFMQTIWDEQVKIWDSALGLSPERLIELKKGFADTINIGLKLFRATTETGKAFQKTLNYFLYSPGMSWSRPKLLSLPFTVAGSRNKILAVGGIVSNIAKIYAVSWIFKLIGNFLRQRDLPVIIDGETNPLMGNWGKIISGDTIFDFCYGDAQFYRTLARLAIGAYIWGTDEKPSWLGEYRPKGMSDIFWQYMKSRETAALSFIGQMATGKDFMGNPIPQWETLARAFPPEMLQSMWDTMQTNGILKTMAAGAASLFSANVATYPEPAYIKLQDARDTAAISRFSKKWENLSYEQQQEITPRLSKLALATAQEDIEKGLREQVYPTKEEIAASTDILDSMTPLVERELYNTGTRIIGIRRTLEGGKFRLNDARFERYKKYVIEYNKTDLQALFISGSYRGMSLADKQKEAKRVMEEANEKARSSLYSDINSHRI